MTNKRCGRWARLAVVMVLTAPPVLANQGPVPAPPDAPGLVLPNLRLDMPQDRADRSREQAERARVQAERQREQAERQREQIERSRERAGQRRDRFENAYEQGQNAIERAQWARAVEQFSIVASAKAPRADAALYWRAYAFDRLNRQSDALTSVSELVTAFPQSRWLGDARALEIQVRQRAGQPVSPEAQADEELKLFAIQGLQHQDPEQAVPMLEKLLQGTQSPRLKERALFVLAQSNSPRARQVMTGIARGNGNPDLQLRAIRYLGMLGSQENRQVLGEIYNASNELDVKRQILRGFMMAGDRQRLLAAATSEKNPELRGEAVRQLGQIGARDEVWQLYQKETDPGVKEQIVQGLFLGGASARLIEIADSDANVELRRRAVQSLGMIGRRQGTSEALLGIYARQTDTAIREAVIEGLFIQQNAESLVTLARKETDRNLKRRMVEKLSLMRSPAARDYLLELLK